MQSLKVVALEVSHSTLRISDTLPENKSGHKWIWMFREQIIQPWRDFSSKTVRTKARTLISLSSVSPVIHSSQCFIKISLHEQTQRGYLDGSRGLVLCLLHTQTQAVPVMFPFPHRQTPTGQTMLPATIISKLVYVLHQSIAQFWPVMQKNHQTLTPDAWKFCRSLYRKSQDRSLITDTSFV